jgi:hypothetical protein
VPPEAQQMVFFFDANLSVYIARMLAQFDRQSVIRHLFDDRAFNRDDEDVVIIDKLSHENPKPVFVTADTNIGRRPLERHALKNSGLSCVFFRKSFLGLGFHTQAWKIVKLWPQIAEEASKCKQPTAFEIFSKANRVEFFCLTKDL